MSTQALILRVQLHDPRYHGRPDWPPSPGRVFQALVAGASQDVDQDETAQRAFRWLETLEPPTIGAPRAVKGEAITYFVPNNDLDAKGGDPEKIPEIRTGKVVQPHLLVSDEPLLYVWRFEGHLDDAERLVRLAEGLYQLGRGLDMAFARAEVKPAGDADNVLAAYCGVVLRPSHGASGAARGGGRSLSTACVGTFESLRRRYAAQGERFQVEGRGKTRTTVFVQPPKARFREVEYESPPDRFLFDLRSNGDPGSFASHPLSSAHGLVVVLRDAARERLVRSMGREPEVEAVLVGARPGEAELVPGRLRARIIPLPSIGHEHTDPAIRRVLVELPQGGPLRAGDVRWAFSGLALDDGTVLVESADDRMMKHFAGPARRWQSLTPLALPAARRRIEPTRQREEAKDAPERMEEEAEAASAVRQALRHAGVRAKALRVDLSREPTLPQGERVEAFAALPRFAKERLWHVDIELDRAVSGPLVLGDGRFLGLGILRPVVETPVLYAWTIEEGLVAGAEASEVAHHLRRAVLSRAGDAWGQREIPAWVSGHEKDGSPAKGHQHLSFLFDPPRRRLVVVTPQGEERWLDAGRRRLAEALGGMNELRAGRAGLLMLREATLGDGDPLLGPSMVWRSVTPYVVNRHERAESAAGAVEADVQASLAALGFPRAESIDVSGVRSKSGVGLIAEVVIGFSIAVEGPVILGRTRHTSGGIFQAGSR